MCRYPNLHSMALGGGDSVSELQKEMVPLNPLRGPVGSELLPESRATIHRLSDDEREDYTSSHQHHGYKTGYRRRGQ